MDKIDKMDNIYKIENQYLISPVFSLLSIFNLARIKKKLSLLVNPMFLLFLLFLVLFCILGGFVYLCIYGQNKMEDSKQLVMMSNATVVDNSTGYKHCSRMKVGGRYIKVCDIIYMTPLQYEFNNETKYIKYNSSIQYYVNNTIYISITKISGEPMDYTETELYLEGDTAFSAGAGCTIVTALGIILFVIFLVYFK